MKPKMTSKLPFDKYILPRTSQNLMLAKSMPRQRYYCGNEGCPLEVHLKRHCLLSLHMMVWRTTGYRLISRLVFIAYPRFQTRNLARAIASFIYLMQIGEEGATL